MGTSSLGQHAAQAGLKAGADHVRIRAVGRCQQLKRQRLQRITRQQGLRFAKLHMYRRLAAAQYVVVHTRHIVVHQRISVYQLYRAGGP